jgi:hypothetical protein
LTVTSPTSGSRSVGIVRSRTQTIEFSFIFIDKVNNSVYISAFHIRAYPVSGALQFPLEAFLIFVVRNGQPSLALFTVHSEVLYSSVILLLYEEQ